MLVGRLEPLKKERFFQGEVFFLLTRPLMDDPLHINSTVENQLKWRQAFLTCLKSNIWGTKLDGLVKSQKVRDFE